LDSAARQRLRAAATPDGHWLLIAIPKERKVAVIDLQSMKVTRSIAVPRAPQEMLVRPTAWRLMSPATSANRSR